MLAWDLLECEVGIKLIPDEYMTGQEESQDLSGESFDFTGHSPNELSSLL